MDQELEDILHRVGKYIENKEKKKQWTAGVDLVKYSGPYFNDKEFKSAVKSLLSGWLVSGKDYVSFEAAFPKYLGKNFGTFTSSGSSANLLMVSSLKNLYGFNCLSRIITPVAGFPTTINPIIQNGFSPIFVDIELDSLNLDLNEVEDIEGADGIIFAPVLGNPPDLNRVESIVNDQKLVYLNDCCDSLGSKFDGKNVGSYGEMSSCSFYPAHHMTCISGGFVATKTKEQNRIIKSLASWGRGCECIGEKAATSKNGVCGKRFSNWITGLPEEEYDHRYQYETIGYNLQNIEMAASIALEQLKKLPQMEAIRQRNYNLLFDIFIKYEEHFILPRPTPLAEPSWFAFGLTIKDKAPFKRKDLINFLEDHKIQTRMLFGGNILLQKAYEGYIPREDAIKRFPNATKATKDTFFLGLSPVVTEAMIQYVGECVEKFFKKI